MVNVLNTVRFGDLPPDKRSNQVKYLEQAEQLKARPGDWALVFEGVSQSTGNNVRKGTLAAFRPEGAFEVATRNQRRPDDGVGDSVVDVYVRYVGGSE